jgi:PKD repeat protein
MKKLILLITCIIVIIFQSNAQTYCIPTYNLPANSSNGITQVVLNTMNHNIGSFSGNYSDFTATLGTELAINETYGISITSASGNAQYYGVYLDYNDDGDFSDANETLYNTNENFGSGLTLSFSFTVPNLTPNFFTRLRIVNYDGFNLPSPCGSFSQGRTADYFIFISPNRLCNYNITNGCGANRITNVTLGGTTLNNTSTCTNFGHSLFPASGSSTAVVSTGSIYPISVTNTLSSVVSCFIDYNHDNLFTGPLEWTQISTSGTLGSNYISIPWDAMPGPTFMRIRSANEGTYNEDISSCTQFTTGETEDYIINIQESGRFANIGSGAVMRGCKGVFDDGSGIPFLYTTGVESNWLIQPDGATSVTCSFYDVGLSTGDYITVYNGTNETAPSLGIIFGNSSSTFTASSGSMFIKLTTFSGVPNDGFTADYSSNGPCDLPCANNLQTNNCGIEFIGNVEVVTPDFLTCDLNKYSTVCVGNAHTVYPPLYCTTSHIIAGDECELNMSFSSSNGAAVAAWVDLNQNNIYESSERVLSNNATTGILETAVFTVPASAQFGEMKMRTRLRTNGNIAASDACTSFSTGETEDYTLFIISSNLAPVSNAPIAAFSANNINIPIGGSVNFTDLSSNSPTSWTWTFTGANPSTSTAQNPTNIVYPTAGCYSVSLTSSNASGSNTNTQTCYIQVGESSSNLCSELFFSEYIEGSSNNKALEIYNPNTSAIDLSGYSIELYANGTTTPTFTQVLSGTLASFDAFVLANSGAETSILNLANITSSACNFNGDDAIVLKNGSNVIDVIGTVGSDPGTFWPAGGASTLDFTLVRNSNVLEPSSNWATVQTQWTSLPTNTISGLGTHASECATSVNTNSANSLTEEIVVFPNPSKGEFTIKIPHENSEITLTDVSGKIISQKMIMQKTASLEINTNGVYFIYVKTNQSISVKKLIIHRD